MRETQHRHQKPNISFKIFSPVTQVYCIGNLITIDFSVLVLTADSPVFQLEVGALTVPLPVEFCGVQYNGCLGASPACGAMGPGQAVQLCSSLTVPTESPDVG